MEQKLDQSLILLDIAYPDVESPAILVDYVYQKHPELFTMPPHSHDFYELFFCRNSVGTHLINFEILPIIENRVYILEPGQIHFLDDKNIEGQVLIFKKELVSDSNFQFSFLLPCTSLKFVDLTDRGGQIVKSLLELITLEQAKPLPNTTIIHNYIYSVFAEISTVYDQKNDGENIQMVFAFLHTLEKNFIEQKSVEYYAKEMNCSIKKLNSYAKSCTGKTPKSLIINKILTEAKKMLLIQDMPVSSIAYDLGFEDASYFGRLFKSQTGLTPEQYRKQKYKNRLTIKKSK